MPPERRRHNSIQEQLIVFTDLDGTLLDHETYSTEPAQEALDRLRYLDIPLVLASSKTAAEMQALRESLGFAHCPAIVENGAGLLQANTGTVKDQSQYQALLSVINDLPKPLRNNFTGFSNWTTEAVAKRTGLKTADAALARQRQFSEPGLWLGDEQSKLEFTEQLGDRGIVVQQGGRFTTLSFGGCKVERVIQLMADFKANYSATFSVALGDASNDIDMLEAVDLGFIIPNSSHEGIPTLDGEQNGSIIRATLPGPAGWNQCIMSVLDNPEKYRN